MISGGQCRVKRRKGVVTTVRCDVELDSTARRPFDDLRHGCIGADTVLKLGGGRHKLRAGKFFLACPSPNLRFAPNSGAQRGHTTLENRHCENNTSLKNKALLNWRLADIHGVSQNTPLEI